jgi:hypothetical protein
MEGQADGLFCQYWFIYSGNLGRPDGRCPRRTQFSLRFWLLTMQPISILCPTNLFQVGESVKNLFGKLAVGQATVAQVAHSTNSLLD